MNIRLATRDDLLPIVDISNWAAIHTPANFAIEPETLSSWMQSFDQTRAMYPWLVAVNNDNQVIGFAKASPHRGRCAYAWTAEVTVYIDHQHHRQGIGTALYELLMPLLKAQGYVTLIAGITVPNPASERLHETFGFKRCATFERVGWKFDQWHDVGYWELILTDGPPAKIRPVADVLTAAIS